MTRCFCTTVPQLTSVLGSAAYGVGSPAGLRYHAENLNLTSLNFLPKCSNDENANSVNSTVHDASFAFSQNAVQNAKCKYLSTAIQPRCLSSQVPNSSVTQKKRVSTLTPQCPSDFFFSLQTPQRNKSTQTNKTQRCSNVGYCLSCPGDTPLLRADVSTGKLDSRFPANNLSSKVVGTIPNCCQIQITH